MSQPWSRSNRIVLSLLLGLLVTGTFTSVVSVVSVASASDLVPRHVPEKPLTSRLWHGLRDDLVIVKFVEGSEVRLREERLVSLTHQDVADANQVLVEQAGLELSRLFSRPEASLEADRARAQLNSGREMADLNNYYKVSLRNPRVDAAETLLDELNSLPIVEVAYAEPIPEMALLGDPPRDRRLPRRDRTLSAPEPRVSGAAPMTPDFQGFQHYMDPAPTGIDAVAAWAHPGGRGETVKIIDIEIGWNWNHEDMKVPFFDVGPPTYGNHGVAVVGVFGAVDNGFGVTGISNAVEVGSYNVEGTPTADAFDQTAANLDPGDIFVIELHCPGPGASGSGQNGYIALEWWQANFDVIAMASANGIICCEAAGNGEADFDSPIYLGLFDRNVRDSGAVIVGATSGAALSPAWFTNYGSRVDLAGWGSDVVTTGYGDLHGGSQNEWYTAQFSGTSSATPIVTGAVACMQGIYKAQSGGLPLSGGTIAQILRDTGTPITGSRPIGARPDLAMAIPAMFGELATIEGTITDAGDESPLAGVALRIVESGTRTSTAPDGSYSLPIPAGSWTVRAELFGYPTSLTNVVTTAGGATIHDLGLPRLWTRPIGGSVVDETGAPVVGAEVSIAETPLPTAITGIDGSFVIDDVPVPMDLLFVATAADRAPDMRRVMDLGQPLSINLRLGEPEPFESTDGGFSRFTGEWTWGIPTYSAGPDAHSGQRCWGTNLFGDYNRGFNHVLDSPSYQLDGLEDPRLGFWHWYSIWGTYDGANVLISTNNGSTWEVIEPVGGYPDACIDGLGGPPCEPGWTNSSDGWQPAVFELADYAGETVRFRFDLGPWGFSSAPGWYVDDLSVHGRNATVAAHAAPSAQSFLAAPLPSPSRGAMVFEYSLSAPGRVELTIFDVAGRQVRSLLRAPVAAGPRLLRWDGRDEQGQPVRAGIYFLRLTADQEVEPGTRSLTRKLVVVN